MYDPTLEGRVLPIACESLRKAMKALGYDPDNFILSNPFRVAGMPNAFQILIHPKIHASVAFDVTEPGIVEVDEGKMTPLLAKRLEIAIETIHRHFDTALEVGK